MNNKNTNTNEKDYLILVGFYIITIFGSFAIIS